jgi:alkylation response protein AidB-like acyl-CoA dehydrogenase
MHSGETTSAVRILEDVLALAPEIRENADAIEAGRRLPDRLLEKLRDVGVFRMATPREYGGPEIDPLTQVRVVEELSAADASVGWNTMIGVTSGYVASRLEPGVARRIFANPKTIIAGQVAPLGRAELVEGGVRVTGCWRFGSACQHATVMMGGCRVYRNGELVKRADGVPEFRVTLFRPETVQIIDTWDTIGMRGTGSHDYAVDDVFVPTEESFTFQDPPRLRTPLYALGHMFLANHAGVPLGIARSAIQEVVKLATSKKMATGKLLREESQTQEIVAECEAKLGAAQAYTYSLLGDVWDTLSRGEELSLRQRALFRVMIVYVHRVGKEIVSAMYDTAATSAIFRTQPLDRHMRDILVTCQHIVVQEKVYRPAGRMLLGLDPGDPYF